MEKIIGLKELRENTETYINAVNKGGSFVVVRRSRPVFKITPIIEEDEEGTWETLVDFTAEGGIEAGELLARMKQHGEDTKIFKKGNA
jgi:prevent-host-death family protein